jgi:radical SAM superfamily enzyme YgiQ (UPF0313 family)
MKIMLIAPASGKWHRVGRKWIFNGKTFRFSLLSLLSVAAETPSYASVEIIDEQVDAIPWEASIYLVGITFMTAAASRTYELAARFRARNIPVVLGGMHPTFCVEEALQHADAVVVGDAEGIWPQVVADARDGRLKGIYRNTRLPDLRGLKQPPRHLLENKKYATVHAIQATRGCPNHCDFCAVSAFHQHSHRQRPVEEVIQEVSAIPSRFFIFVDDNLTADREYARRLFRALIPLRKRWVTQSELGIAEDLELVKLAAKAGCTGVFVGMETFSVRNLESVNKGFNRVQKYREAIRTLHRQGIGVEAGIVFGFDHDDPTVFERTLKLLDKLKIDAAQVSIFTPLPGTRRFETMKDRIFDRQWRHYDFHHTVFHPRCMSAEDLQSGHDWFTNRYYRPGSILRRVWQYTLRPRGLSTLRFILGVNLAYYGRIRRWKINGRNPAERYRTDYCRSESTPTAFSWQAPPE